MIRSRRMGSGRMAEVCEFKLRKLNDLMLKVKVTREFNFRVRVAIWLVKIAAKILGGNIEING
jgi:hypothetical protein